MSSRRRLKRKMSRSEFIQKLRVKCPVCGKTCASSETEAWEMARKQFERFGGEMPKRVYRCTPSLPFWHWTRLEHAPATLRVVRTDTARAPAPLSRPVPPPSQIARPRKETP